MIINFHKLLLTISSLMISIVACGLAGTACVLPAEEPCDGQFTLAITSDRYQLFAAGGSGGWASLNALPLGGQGPYHYDWFVLDPAGSRADTLLNDTSVADPRFTPGTLNGPYEIYGTITDAKGCMATGRVVLTVGTSVGLDVTTTRFGVLAGGGERGQATIQLEPFGGTAPHDISWLVTAPDGSIDNDRLNVSDPSSPVFTSSDEVGTYILTATITDAQGATFVQSVIVIVGQDLGLDVVTSRVAVLPGGGADGTATLLATPIGGNEPYAYAWDVTGPDNDSHDELLSDLTVRSPTFVSGELTGVFILRCTVTDDDGIVLTGSTTITVGQQLAVDVTVDRLALIPNTSGANRARLSVQTRGGREPLALTWSATDDNGNDVSHLLNTTNQPEVTFTASGPTGTFLVRCTVTDADNVTAFDSVVLNVGADLGVTVSADRFSVAATGSLAARSALLTATVHGFQSPFTYAWAVLDPFGMNDPARLTNSNGSTPTFTAGGITGTYTVFCTVTNATGTSATDSLRIAVGQPLNVDITVNRQSLVAGGGAAGQAQLFSTVNGGVAPYSYQWSVIDPGGTSAPARLSDAAGATPVFTTAADTGTYRLTLTVTDDAGTVVSDSLEITAGSTGGPGQIFSGDVIADTHVLAPGGATASIDAITLGGVSPITYAWTVTDPSGSTDNDRLDSTSNASVTFTTDTTEGTYLVSVLMTDSAAATFQDSVTIIVQGTQLSLNVTADETMVTPSTSITLSADRTGGQGPFDYVWSALNSSGNPAGTFTTGSTGTGAATQSDIADDATNGWSVSVVGSYSITCTVTDSAGVTFTDSVSVVVSGLDIFSLDVTADTTVVWPSETVNLTGNQTSGTGPFTYGWSAVDESGSAAGVLGATTQSGVAGDTTNTWQAPAGGAGTYRITCTVTDALGNTLTDSVIVTVTAIALQNVFLEPVDSGAPAAVLLGVTNITAAAAGAAPGQTLAGVDNPDYPRNVVITITNDIDNSITGGTVSITGLDARGETQTELIALNASAGTSSTTTGTKPFAVITQANLYDVDGLDIFGINEKISIAVGNKFGLTGLLDNAGDIRYVSEGGTVLTAGYTVDVTAGQQGITFATAPNGSRNYLVVFRAR